MKLTDPAMISRVHLWELNFVNTTFAPPTIYHPTIKHRMKTTALTKPTHSLAVQSLQSPPIGAQLNPGEPFLAIQLPEAGPGLRKTTKAGNKQLRNGSARKITADLQTESLQIQFCLYAPDAQSVQLAGDFSDWEKSSVKMIKEENGIWKASVALPPGRHSYRFLVDGEWCDDPNCAQYVPNPFGGVNAVIEVF